MRLDILHRGSIVIVADTGRSCGANAGDIIKGLDGVDVATLCEFLVDDCESCFRIGLVAFDKSTV